MSHYVVLGLSPNPDTTKSLSPTDVKAAYKKSLLIHHPDKSLTKKNSAPKTGTYTIDEINHAYNVLSDKRAKREYDCFLKLQGEKPQNDLAKEHPGLETVDLDDMQFDEPDNIWYRGCRCGKDRGFEVTEDELEAEAQHGEIIVGCNGCSLWLRVTFQVAEEA